MADCENGKLFFFLHLLEICMVGKTYRHMHKTVNELASYLILKTPSGDKPDIVNYEIVSLYVNYLPDSRKRSFSPNENYMPVSSYIESM